MFPNYCIIELQYKPFMWCRSDVRLWHVRLLFSVISPLCGVALTPDCGIIILVVSSRGVIQTLVWHQYYYSCSFLSRSHSDPRLAPSILFLVIITHMRASWIFCLSRDWRYDHRIFFRNLITLDILCPRSWCLRVHSNVLTGLSLAIVLARFLAWR